MKTFQSEQVIGQLEKRKGGYFYLKIEAGVVNQFQDKRHTRFVCTLDNKVTFQCGLNHLGDGNFFIILSAKNLNSIKKSLGGNIYFELNEDPNPLGVDVPEVLRVVLAQYDDLRAIYESLTLGKKRSIIHSINKIKDIDKQIQKTIEAINESIKPRKKKSM